MDNTKQSTQPVKSGPKDVFLNLLVTVTLYASVIGLLTLLFQYINIGFPDQLEAGYWAYSSAYDKIRWATSVLFVMFGVYLFLSWNMEKSYKTNPTLRDLKARKWLVHLTIFASAITLIIDLITLIYRFMNGDLTMRIGLKVLAILIVAGATFAYYYWDSKRLSGEQSKLPKTLAWVAGIIVVVTIVAGFFIAGSPAEQRKRRFDEQRVNDLSMIQSEVMNYWQRKRTLPQQLNDLNNDTMGFRAPLDPETGAQYDYLVVEPLKFKLCTEFAMTSMPSSYSPAIYPSMKEPYGGDWEHGEGKVCFDRTIDPSLYPTPEEPVK